MEKCNNEELTLSCSINEIVFVTSAEYGRMSVGRCITEEDEFMGCTNDVLPLLDRWCSGRQECSFRVGNDELEAANDNCRKILKQYLKLDYSCLEGKLLCKCVILGGNGYLELCQWGYIIFQHK